MSFADIYSHSRSRSFFLIPILLSLALIFGWACSNKESQDTTGWHESTESEERPLFTEHFPPEEFAERREGIYQQIEDSDIAIIQGATMPRGFEAFRQNNEMYYLTGIESPHAYLIMNKNTRESTIYLPSRKDQREYSEGKVLSHEDADLVKKLSGIDNVKPLENIADDLNELNRSTKITTVYTPISPYEGRHETRSMVQRTVEDRAEDPLDNRPARYEHFIERLESLAPSLLVENLDPILDELRKIKSEREIELIKKSTELQVKAIEESMRSTESGVKPYQLEAVSKFIYQNNNYFDEAYYALIHFGPDAFQNHYHNSIRPARAGDMILMDYGPYYGYYTSDMARMWPVDGKFNDVQRELYTFYLKYYEAILYNIKKGLTPQEVRENALPEIEEILDNTEFSDEHFEQAATDFVNSFRESVDNPDRGLGHGVGLAVHDVGDYSSPIEPGMVFVIEPQFRIPQGDIEIYIRLEDMILVTENGVEILTDDLPRDIESIEKIVQQDGLLQKIGSEFNFWK